MIKPAAVDLSHWNSIIGDSYSAALASLQRLQDSGILGLIHKATESISYVDDHLKARADLCRDAQMMFGTYHFLRPGNIGSQVAFYYDTVMGIQKTAGESDHWVWSCDYEDPNIPLSDVADFMEQLQAVIGQLPVLYTGFALKDKIAAGQDTSRLVDYPLWLAHYASAPILPEGWNEYWLWQYSDKASVPGIEAPTDVNAFEGTVEDLVQEWTDQEPQEPEPKPGPPALSDKIKVTVIVPAGVEVEVIHS